MKRILLLVSIALAACGGGNSSALSRNNSGSGTSTLQVTGEIEASLSSGGPITAFAVNVQDGLGNPVSGATVTVTNSDFGAVPLVEANAGSGTYVNSKSSWSNGDFQLDVTRTNTSKPSDKISGVVVGGPGTSTINAPKANTTYAAGPALLALSWTTPSQAKAVSVHTRDFDADVPDTGSFSIPASMNPPRSSQLLRLTRYNEVDVAGGLSGSRLRVGFSTTVSPFVVQ